jgi:hypothetical protein
MNYPTARAVAIAIALMHKRAAKSRTRLTEKTFRLISRRRERLHDSFITSVRAELDERGLIFFRLGRGGFGMLPAAALDGAPAIRASEYLAEELPEIRRGRIDEEAFAAELEDEADSEPDDED